MRVFKKVYEKYFEIKNKIIKNNKQIRLLEKKKTKLSNFANKSDKKVYELVSERINSKIENCNKKKTELEKLFEQEKIKAFDIAKKYFCFETGEIADEFRNVCKKFYNSEPIVQIDVCAEIVHDKDEPDFKTKRPLKDFLSKYENNDDNTNYRKRNENGIWDPEFFYIQIQLKNKDKNQFEFIYINPINLKTKLSDGTTLKDNLTTRLVHEYSKQLGDEYFTYLHIKESAKNKIIIPLSPTKLTALGNKNITKEVVDNLYRKALKKYKKDIELELNNK